MTDEECEVGLPQKGLNLLIKDTVPDVRMANESRDLLNVLACELVKHLSREAQRISVTDQRKTICHEHVQKALNNFGFPLDYIEAADSVLDECKQAAQSRRKRKNTRLEKCGIPEERLYEIQQQLIEKARAEQADAQANQAAQFRELLMQCAEQEPTTTEPDDDLDEDYDVE